MNPTHLKRLSTCLITIFFTQSSIRCLWNIDDHTSFVTVATSANMFFVKIFMISVSVAKLVATAMLFPFFAEIRNGQKIACACLVGASFLEMSIQGLSSDNSAATTSFFLLLTCSFRLLESLSSRNLRIYHGSIGEKARFDNFLENIRRAASRYKASSTTTILIVCLFSYTICTTDTLLWRTKSLKRQIALSKWSQTASVIALLSAIGSAENRKLGNKKMF